MAEPVRLQLLVGPAVPLPAPRSVIDAIQSVKVEDADAQSPDANKLTVVVACTGAWTAT